MSDYSAPAAPSTGVDLNPLNGRLLLITVHDMRRDIQTVHGLSDAARVDIVVLDGPDAGTEHNDVLIFPRVMRAQLEKSIGAKVLGRLGQGVKKPGQNPPWIMSSTPPTAAEIAVAQEYEAKKRPTYQAPAADDLF